MNVQYKTENGRIVISGQPKNVKDAFKMIASVQEVFEEHVCGLCGSSTRFECRTFDGNTYYNLRCTNDSCRAQLDFGQHKEGGTLFVKRTKDGHTIGKGGWYIYQREEQSSSAPSGGGGSSGGADSFYDDPPAEEVPF